MFKLIQAQPLAEKEILMGPMMSNNHWVLYVFFLKTGEVVKLSSLKNYRIENEKHVTSRFRELFRKFNSLNEARIKTRLHLVEYLKTPQQKMSSNDCGVFVISFIENILKSSSLKNIEKGVDINMYRRHIGKLLLDYPDEQDVTNSCIKCGCKALDFSVHWVKCVVCLRWIHVTCIKKVNDIPKRFECFLCNKGK